MWAWTGAGCSEAPHHPCYGPAPKPQPLQPGWLASDHESILQPCCHGLRPAAAHLPAPAPGSGIGLDLLVSDPVLAPHPISCSLCLCVSAMFKNPSPLQAQGTLKASANKE